MLYSIEDDWLPYAGIFDEFPDRSSHAFEFTTCACGERNGTLVSTTSRHRNFSPIVMCERCGTMRANPYFTRATAEFYYSKVFGAVKRGGVPAKEHQEETRRRSVRNFLLPHIDAFATVLDFGGGSGGRTLDLMEDGKQVSLIEVEGEYSQAAYAAGISKHEEGARYDLVVASHVIEHLLDPRVEMRNVIEQYGKPNGLILVATPFSDLLKPRKWLNMFHIAHKYYFNRQSLIGIFLEIGARPIAQDDRDSILFEITDAPDPDEAARCFERGRQTAEQMASRAKRQRIQRAPSELIRRLRGRRTRAVAPIF